MRVPALTKHKKLWLARVKREVAKLAKSVPTCRNTGWPNARNKLLPMLC